MNFSEIKAFLGAKSTVSPNETVQSQLRETGLQQAAEGIRSGNASSVSQLSSQTSVSLRIYNNSLNQTLQVNDKRANLPVPPQSQESLFDFEEIAKNVLRFVGGVISSAAKSGADEETLTSLFEQARSGVAKGIKLAEKDLGGFLNEEISNGISQSADLIEAGIQRLQDELLGTQVDENGDPVATSRVDRSFESVAVSRQQSASLNITTKDGDEVSIQFNSANVLSFNQQVIVEQNERDKKQDENPRNDVLPPKVAQTDEVSPSNLQASTRPTTAPNNAETENVGFEKDNASQPSSVSVRQQTFSYSESDFSFTVNGELDEAELDSIGKLVSDANDLATTFFDGDIETAFNQALELGFDEQELTGFALQLSRQERVEVVKAYESVSQYNGNNDSAALPSKPVERVSDYLQKMLGVLEQSQQKLADGEQYDKLITGLVNQIRDVATTDLVSAINDFHAFNKKLIDNLPSQKEES